MALIGEIPATANQQTLTIESQQSIRVLGELVDISPSFLLLVINDRSLHLHSFSSWAPGG